LFKNCKGCGIEKKLEDFYKNNHTKDGRGSKCKECVKERAAEYRKANPKPKVERKPRQTGFRLLPEGMRKCSKCDSVKPKEDFYKDNKRSSGVGVRCKDCVNSYLRKRKSENYYEILERRREWRESNRLKLREQDAAYREANRDKKRLTEAKRRARKQSLPDTLTLDETNAILEKFEGKCALCDHPSEALDHFIPLASGKGGTTKENIIPLCKAMNTSKLHRNPFVWAETCLNDEQKERFELLVEYLAEINGLEVNEYREFVFSCFKSKNTNIS
jgi:hypothetical protein